MAHGIPFTTIPLVLQRDLPLNCSSAMESEKTKCKMNSPFAYMCVYKKNNIDDNQFIHPSNKQNNTSNISALANGT